MPACPSCGHENPAEARFCNSCGAALVASEPAREQRKVVTVLFCDLVGSTALGEATDPEALRARMSRYFDDVRGILERHGGAVEKFVGDAVMAVFGIPVSHEDDALRAARAAGEILKAVSAHGLEARIGVNTGEVVVGGDGQALVVGDAVNVAARLEQAAPPGAVLIGHETFQLVRNAVRVEELAPLRLKGKAESVEAFRLLEVVGDTAVVQRHLDRPLVGRERERERLWREYEDVVAEGACRLVTLLGPAGIGKSRLVSDFLERLGGSADVLRGRCLPYGEGITYWPLVEMLVPLGIEPGSVVAISPAETRVAFRRLLEARAAESPQVVVIDDLQWAEPLFVELVEHVADFARNTPIMLLCVARSEFLERWTAWAGGKPNVTSVPLAPLGERERFTLIQNLPGGALLDEAVRTRISQASEGNPLYLEEMVAMLEDDGTSGSMAVPPTIQALLQARLDSLDHDERLVLEYAAIEGQVFHRGAIIGLGPELTGPALDPVLSALVRRDLLVPDAPLMSGDEAYRFRNILIRDAAYAAMPKMLRASLHEQLADWLDAARGSGLELDEVLGYHLEQAHRLRAEVGLGDADLVDLARRAATKLLSGGRRALGRGDNPGADRLLSRAVELFPADDPHLCDALIALGYARFRSGRLEEAMALLRDAVREARASGDARSEDRARLALGSFETRIAPDAVYGKLDEALAIAESAERRGDVSTQAEAYLEIGMYRFMRGRAADGSADLARAAELAGETGQSLVERRALSARLRPLAWGPTPAEEAIAYCDRVLGEDVADASLQAHAHGVKALLSAMRGDRDGFLDSSSRADSLIHEFGLTLLVGTRALDVGAGAVVLGELELAERELRRGDELLASLGEAGNRASIVGILADVLSRQGRHEDAEAAAAECRSLALSDDRDAQPRWRTALARVGLGVGALDEAESLAREAGAILEPYDFIPVLADVLFLLGEILQSSGRAPEAKAAIERALVLYEQKGNVVSAREARSQLSGIRASAS